MTSTDKDARGGKARTWNGRYVNIAHRRTPSELTPLIQQNLALQQQVEMLTAQNLHMMHQQMSSVPMPAGAPPGARAGSNAAGQKGAASSSQIAGVPQLLPPPPPIFSHHRGSSIGGGSQQSGGHLRQRSMGHVRRHSLAVNEAKRAAQERSTHQLSTDSAEPSNPPNPAETPSSASASSGTFGSPGPILDSVPQFRFPPSPDRASTERQPWGHSRSQSMSSPYRRQTPSPQPFQFPPAEPKTASAASSSAAASGSGNLHLHTHQHQGSHSYHNRRYSNWQSDSASGNSGNNNTFYGHRPRPSNASDYSPNQQQGRKSLFVPYLPQSMIPEMLADGLLVTGTLRVNHKNRSYAYVSTDLLDADVFIAGSKDRNRALEGDLVAVELLDVDDVWEQKREKEERKRRRGGDPNDSRLVETQEGQLRRRGSLKQREPQKRSDDIEVEGQTLLLREEVGNGDEKPLYAGHVVAILERSAGQLFSGTLGLLRPSSQANRDRQQNHSRTASTSSIANDDGTSGSHSNNNNNNNSGNSSNNNNNNNAAGNNGNTNKPKIVWFKPVDKCVPLMAIPTEQAPADLIDNPQAYANQVFVAQIKRWPITSLHPFGMLVERLGSFGDPNVSQIAVLRDFNFGAHVFSSTALAEALETGKAMEEGAKELPLKASDVSLLTQDMAASIYKDQQETVLAIHVLDITPYLERGSSLDRELRHKSSGVYMDGFELPLVSSPESIKAVEFQVGRRSPTLTVEFHLESGANTVSRQAVIPKDSALTSPEEVLERFAAPASALRRKRGLESIDDNALDLTSLLDVVVPARAPLSTPSRSELIVTELMHAVNAAIASELLRSTAIGLNALVRRQSEPSIARIEQFTELLKLQDIRVDTTSAHTLARSLAEQLNPRQATAVKATLAKILGRQRYAVAARTNPGQLGHYWFGFDAYTHFARPLLRYSDHVVARQVHTMLGTNTEGASPAVPTVAELARTENLHVPGAGSAADSASDSASDPASASASASDAVSASGAPTSAPTTPILESSSPATPGSAGTSTRSFNASAGLGSPVTVPGSSDNNSDDQSGAFTLAPELSFRYECAHGAQEQSFHLSLAQKLTDKYELHLAVVTAVYESAFDVVIPELSVEKRVHGDQLPLVKAEFHPSTQLLELFWKRDATTQLFQPENDDPLESAGTPGITVTTNSEAEIPAIPEEMRTHLKLRPDEYVQEIRPFAEIPVLIRVVAADRVLPSIVVVAACPFSS